MCCLFVAIPLYVIVVTSFKTMAQITEGDIFSLPHQDCASPTTQRTGRQAFYFFIGKVGHEHSATGNLARRLRDEHRDFLVNRFSKANILAHLTAHGLNSEDLATFEDLWQSYQESESKWQQS